MNIKRILFQLIPRQLRLDRVSKGIANRHHRGMTRIAEEYLEKIKQGKLELVQLRAKQDLIGKRIIWQYWGQGLDKEQLPDVVQLCFSSVDKYAGEYEVIRLTDKTIGEYIDLDDIVWERYQRGQENGYKAAFFSDVLRVALLSTYGGIWLDATILMTDYFPSQYLSLPFFAYQRDNNQKDRGKWQQRTPTYFGWGEDFKVKLLSSIMSTEPEHIIPTLLYTMLVRYCKDYDRLAEYFLLQIFFQTVVDDPYYAQYNCPTVSDCLPHQMIFDVVADREQEYSIKDVVSSVSLHKLTYMPSEDLVYLQERLQICR